MSERLEEHWPDLLRFARSLAGNVDSAHEIAQESMVRALARNPQLPEIANTRGWLFQIAANVCREWWHRQARESASLAQLVALRDNRQQMGNPLPPEIAEQRERLTDIWEFIQTLPDIQRQVLVKQLVDGSSHQQIADQLGISKDNVKANLCVARQKLRQRFLKIETPAIQQDRSTV